MYGLRQTGNVPVPSGDVSNPMGSFNMDKLLDTFMTIMLMKVYIKMMKELADSM